jgi:hypothetical protein
LPFDSARFLEAEERDGPDFQPVEAAIAEFRSGHPYLLFDKRATSRIRQRANLNRKLLVQRRYMKRAQAQSNKSCAQGSSVRLVA